MDFIVIKSIHLTAILFVFGTLLIEFALVKPALVRAEIKRLAVVDAIYGISAVAVLISGLAMVFFLDSGKGSAFYTSNFAFYIKLALFIIIGLLSIVPTVFFLKNNKGDIDENVKVPDVVNLIIRAEILLILCLPLLGVLLANGVSFLF